MRLDLSVLLTRGVQKVLIPIPALHSLHGYPWLYDDPDEDDLRVFFSDDGRLNVEQGGRADQRNP